MDFDPLESSVKWQVIIIIQLQGEMINSIVEYESMPYSGYLCMCETTCMLSYIQEGAKMEGCCEDMMCLQVHTALFCANILFCMSQ